MNEERKKNEKNKYSCFAYISMHFSSRIIHQAKMSFTKYFSYINLNSSDKLTKDHFRINNEFYYRSNVTIFILNIYIDFSHYR